METNHTTAPYQGAFADRRDAGRRLASRLAAYKDRHPVVLAVLRGGLPVGYEIAKALDAPLDALFVRKLRVPGFTDLALGAVVDCSQPQPILNQSIIDSLHVTSEYIESEVRAQLQIIEEHKRRYRGDRQPLNFAQRTVILADDGIATGSTIRAGLKALALGDAASKVVAVPVAPPEAVQSLASEADELACLVLPAEFNSIGFYYADFTPPTDDEIIELLRKTSSPAAGAMPGPSIRWGM